MARGMPPAVSAGGLGRAAATPLPSCPDYPVPLPPQPRPHTAHLLLLLRYCGHGVLQRAAVPQLLQVSGCRGWEAKGLHSMGFTPRPGTWLSDSVGASLSHP